MFFMVIFDLYIAILCVRGHFSLHVHFVPFCGHVCVSVVI